MGSLLLRLLRLLWQVFFSPARRLAHEERIGPRIARMTRIRQSISLVMYLLSPAFYVLAPQCPEMSGMFKTLAGWRANPIGAGLEASGMGDAVACG